MITYKIENITPADEIRQDTNQQKLNEMPLISDNNNNIQQKSEVVNDEETSSLENSAMLNILSTLQEQFFLRLEEILC